MKKISTFALAIQAFLFIQTKRRTLVLLGLTVLVGSLSPAMGALRVVATTPELASIARSVGGGNVSVVSLSKPGQDYHKIEARPSFVTQVAQAAIVIRIGLDLDVWMDALLNAAHNTRVAKGGVGYVDASTMIRKLDLPKGRVTGASGDIHVLGNPHFWLDPGNGKVIAYEILLALRRVDAKNAPSYDSNYKRFVSDIDKRIVHWESQMKPLKNRPVVAYHAEWVYFYKRFGLRAFGYLEPKPGIPPSAGHLSRLINRMKSAHVTTIIVPDIYPMRFPEMVAKETNALIARVPYSVGSMGTDGYIDYIDKIVSSIIKTLK